ncbi:MAG TPA: hypothetical protein DC057_01560 [Spirochaetia bacterium]|nr:hypothetical protein [Spirochaetia bacterium]
MKELFNPAKDHSKIIEIEENNPLFADRHTMIRGNKIESTEYGADFHVDTSLGIKISTDSEKLAREIESVFSAGNVQSKPAIEFIYLTKRGISATDTSEILPKPISVGILGDLVVDETLTQYILAGSDKFGSLESVLFGIYSFERAREGFLGLHATQIYDSKKHVSHIITGSSGVGKSTVAQLLERLQPGRFIVLADDWVEIDPSQNNVRPISTAFGSRAGTLADEMISLNPRIKDKFTSFGKNFYTHEGIKSPTEVIGSIILLLDSEYEHSKKGMVDYFINSNHHIPFMTQIRTEASILPFSIINRLENMLLNFSKLQKNKNFSAINITSEDIYQNVFNILKLID